MEGAVDFALVTGEIAAVLVAIAFVLLAASVHAEPAAAWLSRACARRRAHARARLIGEQMLSGLEEGAAAHAAGAPLPFPVRVHDGDVDPRDVYRLYFRAGWILGHQGVRVDEWTLARLVTGCDPEIRIPVDAYRHVFARFVAAPEVRL